MNLFKAFPFISLVITFFTLSVFASFDSDQNLSHVEIHKRKILALISKAESQLEWRGQIRKLYDEMVEHAKVENGEISARHLDKLRKSIDHFTQKIVPSLDIYKDQKIDFLNSDNIIEVTEKEKSSVDYSFSRLGNVNDLRSRGGRRSIVRKTVTKVVINPKDDKGKELLDNLVFQVLSRLVTLENFSLALIPFMGESSYRQVLMHDISNQTSQKIENAWHDFINTLYKSDNLADLTEVIDDNLDVIEASNKINLSAMILYEGNLIYKYIKERRGQFTFFKDMAKTIQFMTSRQWDAYKSIGTETLYMASMAFGNTVGLVQYRRGYLFEMSKEDENSIAKRMKPLDVLFEKTPFRLTDRFIPGYFGHNAVWTGTEQELKDIGVWDQLPEIYMNAVEKFGYQGDSFQSDIRAGVRIIEALRPGVQINTLRDFLDIDDFAVMRAEECEEWRKDETFCLTPETKKEYLIKAFSQIGKDYDFAFDVNTEDTIVCSELLYRTFLDINFETTLTVGSYNITPDQVAYQGDEEGDIFTPVILYHKGVEITEGIRALFYDLLHPVQ